MVETFWIFIALGILLATILVWYYFAKKSSCPFDYYSMFIIGVVWMPVGFILGRFVPILYWLGGIGLLFLIIGLIKKKTWRKRCMWIDLSGIDKWVRIIVIVVLVILLAIGIYFILKGGAFI